MISKYFNNVVYIVQQRIVQILCHATTHNTHSRQSDLFRDCVLFFSLLKLRSHCSNIISIIILALSSRISIKNKFTCYIVELLYIIIGNIVWTAPQFTRGSQRLNGRRALHSIIVSKNRLIIDFIEVHCFCACLRERLSKIARCELIKNHKLETYLHYQRTSAYN